MKNWRLAALLASAALLPADLSAQNVAPEGPNPAAADKPGAAPAAGREPPAQAEGLPANARPGRPANLCTELVAFLHQPEQAKAAAAPPPQTATAVQAPAPQGGTAQPSSSGGVPQEKSGMSGQVAPSGPGAAGPQGAAQNAAAPPGASPGAPPPPAHPSGQAAQPAAPAPPPAPKPTPAAVEKAENAARDNNLHACRDAAQEMRRAGVAMPAPLLALAALDPKFFEGGQ